MPDDMLRDAIETSRRVLDNINDFDTEGELVLLPSLVHSFPHPNRSPMRGNNKK
jgi:hypothetical protein